MRRISFSPLYANDISNAKTVTKINRINFHSVINELNLGSIIYPRIITVGLHFKICTFHL